MVAWTHALRALAAITALLICTQALPVPKVSQVERRMIASSSGFPGPKLTFGEVYSGMFQPNGGVDRPMIPGSIPNNYGHMYFKDGAPIYVFANDASRISKLDMEVALKTFGKFHIFNADTRRYVTIIPKPDAPGQAIQSRGWGNIHEHMEQIARTREGFGPHVATVAHGLPVSSKTKKVLGFKTESAPEWKKVFEADPVSQDPQRGQHAEDFRRGVRMALDRNRHVRFVSSDGARTLGLRAKSDGSIELKLKNLVGDLSHFHG